MLCDWGAGWGFIPCFSVTLSPSSFTLRAFGVSWFLGHGSCSYACLCTRGPFGALILNFHILGFHIYAYAVMLTLLTYLFAIPLFPRGPWPSPRARTCACCVGGAGYGVSYHPCFSLTLSPSSCTLRAFGVSWFLGRGSCFYASVCMRGPFSALLRTFNILSFHLYAYVVPGVWALNILVRHTIPLAFFFPFSCTSPCFESMEEWGCGCGWCWYACFTTCVVLLFVFACGVVSLAPSFTTYLVSSPMD